MFSGTGSGLTNASLTAAVGRYGTGGRLGWGWEGEEDKSRLEPVPTAPQPQHHQQSSALVPSEPARTLQPLPDVKCVTRPWWTASDGAGASH